VNLVDDLAFLIDDHGHALVSAGVRVEGAVGLPTVRSGKSLRRVISSGRSRVLENTPAVKRLSMLMPSRQAPLSRKDVRLFTVGDELVIAEAGEGERLDSSQGASPALDL
jgi:hypothetical protein